MHGLDSSTDLSFLVGSMLIQVSVGQNELIFCFEPRTLITVESTFGIGDETSMNYFTDAPSSASKAAALLGLEVEGFDISDTGTTTLHFQGGSRVTVLDDSEHYESYTIIHGTKTIVV